MKFFLFLQNLRKQVDGDDTDENFNENTNSEEYDIEDEKLGYDEFRLFLLGLRQYYTYCQVFNQLCSTILYFFF